MSSINPYFTFHYVQPEEYRFSHDSVFLARKVFERYSAVQDRSSLRGLDLCSGCGIIGLDFLFHLQSNGGVEFASFDFLEVQEIYEPYFQKNALNLRGLPTSLRFLNQNYSILNETPWNEAYDLILCNPPYFHLNQGKLSPSEFKNRCRFFIDSDFPNLLKGIENALAPQGEAYVLLRNQKEHGWNALDEARKILSSRCSLDSCGDIRGTDLVLIQRK